MSYCKEEGKDKIIFVTKEDHKTPSNAVLYDDDDDDEEPGLILPNGDINWSCPCLGGMASGPCGVQFRDAFSCFHYSVAEPKGSDCYEPFQTMQDCMNKFPALYPTKDDNEDPGADLDNSLSETVKDGVDSDIKSDENSDMATKDS